MAADFSFLSSCQKLGRRQQFLCLILIFVSQAILVITLLSSYNPWTIAESNAVRTFIVNTVGCKIPNIDPFDQSVYEFLNESTSIICYSAPPLTYTDGRYLRINRTALNLHYNDSLDFCQYETIIRPQDEKSDNAFRYLRAVQFSDDLDVRSEFVRVACFGQKGSMLYSNFHAFMIKKDEVETKCAREHDRFLKQNRPKEVFNFFILGMDSVSRLNFIRHMPRTRSLLVDKMGAIELQGYNKVADNTYVNLVPMFAGKYVEELPWDERFSEIPFDNFTFVWNRLSKLGYRTLYAEDAPQIAIFNYNKAGFHKPPADYYLRPFSLALEDHGSMWKHDHDCVGNKLETDIVLDWIYEFEETFRDDAHLSFAFVTRLTHDNINKARLADDPYYNFFRKMHTKNLLDNTFVIFYSDHGMRFGGIRQTYVGKLEERLPFMYLILPKKLLKDYSHFAAAVKVNANRLSTPFDIYETLNDLINFSGTQRINKVTSRGMTLFSDIPLERTCEHATILPHWCTCHEMEEISTEDKTVVQISQYIVRHINNLLKIHGPRCALLTLASVNHAQKILPNDKVMQYISSLHDVLGRTVRFSSKQQFAEYQLMVTADPGGGVFEATVRFIGSETEDTIEIVDISRINEYALQSACIDFHSHKKFCYCQ